MRIFISWSQRMKRKSGNTGWTSCKNLRTKLQKQPSRGVLRKRCSENMQQIYSKHQGRSAISVKLPCNFIEITLLHGCSPVNLLHVLRAPFLKNTSRRLLLKLYQNPFFFTMKWNVNKPNRKIVKTVCETAFLSFIVIYVIFSNRCQGPNII